MLHTLSSFPQFSEVLLFCVTTVFFIDLISVVIFQVVAEDPFMICWVSGLLAVVALLRFTAVRMSVVLPVDADGAVVPDREEREIQSLLSLSSTLGCPLFCTVLVTGTTAQCAGHWSY